MPNKDSAELREQILKAGTTSKGKITVNRKMYSNGAVSPITTSSQDIVEIGIDDLMELIQAHPAAQVAASEQRAEGIGRYMSASMLLEKVGYLLAHRAEGGLPEMTAQVIGELYTDVKKILEDNSKYMKSDVHLTTGQNTDTFETLNKELEANPAQGPENPFLDEEGKPYHDTPEEN